MTDEMSFREKVKGILSRHQDSTLISRWEEAAPSETDSEPLAFWIRESDDLVNIVWLGECEIRDITWYPQQNSSTFNLLIFSAISGFEVRQAENVAKNLGFSVAGDFMVEIHTYSMEGGLYWVASNDKERAQLRAFLDHLIKAVLRS